MKKKIIKGTEPKLLFSTAINEYSESVKIFSKEEILVFVLQRPHRAYWKNILNNDFSSNISSYFSFIQREIKLNWDLVIKNSKLVEKNTEKPVFLTFEGSQTLMGKLIEFFKEKGGLKEIAFSSEELCQKMLSNLYYMATNNTSYFNYHKLIQNQELNKDLLKPETYEELTRLLEVYINRTLKEGVIDYPAAFYIFNNSLLKDKIYLESLKRFKKVIVTEFECQIPAITGFLEKFENISLYENSCGPYGIYFPNGKKDSGFLDDFEITHIKSHENKEFQDKLYRNLFFDENNSLGSDSIVINNGFESKSGINEYLLKLIKKLGKNKNISVLSPVRNPVLEYVLSDYCKEKNLPFINLDKNEKITDNPHVYALSSLALIYFNYGNIYLNSDEIRQILVLIFDINYFAASLLAKKIKMDRNFCETLLKNSKNLGEKSLDKIVFFKEYLGREFGNVHEFFTGLHNEKEKMDEEVFTALKKLINISKGFAENMEVFRNIKDSNLEFFLSLRKGLKESESLDEIYEKLEFTGIILGTPSSFLTYSKTSDITVMIDTENNLWNINFVNIIQNPFMLNGYFSKEFFYDFETYNQLKREELFNLLSRIGNLTREKLVFLSAENSYTSLLKDKIIK